MIRVTPEPEPPQFDELVRAPGAAFLRRRPSPTAKQFSSRAYWSRVSSELRAAYKHICSYSCLYIPPVVGAPTVEHFKPKKLFPKEAYEWQNYRLVCSLLNGRKQAHEDVLDPFLVQNGWFVLRLPENIVVPAKDLADEVEKKVKKTINRLRLNDDEACIQARNQWLSTYVEFSTANEPKAFEFLKRMAPFIAMELERQDLRGDKIVQRLTVKKTLKT